MFLPPPLKSSAAMRAASTEPMPLVSWNMPEMSLSTPTRTTSSEISACAAPQVMQVAASAATQFKPFIVFPLCLVSRFRSLPGAMVQNQTCRSGSRSTRPSSSGVILIWQDSRLFGAALGCGAIQQLVLVVANRRLPGRSRRRRHRRGRWRRQRCRRIRRRCRRCRAAIAASMALSPCSASTVSARPSG